MPEVRPLTVDRLPELERLFRSDASATGCWCMWFIIRVQDYHQGGAPENAAKFKALAAEAAHPLGVIATLDGEPVGWAAAGPRSRYARAVRTPTMKHIDQAENDAVWLVPCLFIRQGMRGQGIARHLLAGAVHLASASGAAAIEGFPAAGSKRSSTDRQVGTERLFAACGFTPASRPTSKRVVMRLKLPA